MDSHRFCNLNPEVRIKSQEVDQEVLTPRPEASELLEIGLGTVNGEGCDDPPHFVLVGERTERDYDHNDSVSSGLSNKEWD